MNCVIRAGCGSAEFTFFLNKELSMQMKFENYRGCGDFVAAAGVAHGAGHGRQDRSRCADFGRQASFGRDNENGARMAIDDSERCWRNDRWQEGKA